MKRQNKGQVTIGTALVVVAMVGGASTWVYSQFTAVGATDNLQDQRIAVVETKLDSIQKDNAEILKTTEEILKYVKQ